MTSPLTVNRGRLGSVVAAVALVLAPLAMVPASAAEVPVTDPQPRTARVAPTGSVERCDPTGDRHHRDDCITHRLAGRAKDGRIATQRPVAVDVRRHAALRGIATALDVQLRRIHTNGTAGRWRTIRTVQVHAGVARASFTPCFTHLAGRYEFRLRSSVPADATMPARTRSATATVTSAPVPVTVRQASSTCVNSEEEDEQNVEFFNQLVFLDMVGISVAPAPADPSAAAVTLQCGDGLEAAPSLQVQLMSFGGQLVQACQGSYSTATVIVQATDAFCAATGECDFVVYAVNAQTGLIYSATELRIQTFSGGAVAPVQVVPELEPATKPLCDNSVSQCLLTGECRESQSELGALQLCQGANPADCAPPPGPNGSYIILTPTG